MDKNWNDYFEYNEDSPSGLVWKVNIGRIKKGATAGYLDERCWRVRLDGIGYKAHRVVWFLRHKVMLGKSEQIDHIDRNPFNNRIENLRVVTQAINNRNKTKFVINKSGVTGIHEVFREGVLKSYVCSWYDDGKRVSVSFDIQKIGKEMAFRFAKELRETKIKYLSLTMGYTVDHGQ